MSDSPARPALLAILAAFAAVYLIWGSTYLAILFAIDTMPPFLMAAARWLVAGGILYAWRRSAGHAAPTRREWRSAAVVGAALIVGGNGAVSWAEQHVPSGLTALIIATVPLWMVLMQWGQGVRPQGRVLGGVGVGIVGMALLIGPSSITGGEAMHPLGVAAILFATVSWAAGSLYARRAPLPKDSLLGASAEMLAGGLALAVIGLLAGEAPRVDVAAISLKSWLAFAFLVFAGSIVGFSAYVWLLKVVTPSRASTYAFVNPVVAVFLGWLLASEPLTAVTAVAAGLIVVAVAIIVTAQAPRPAAPPRGGDRPPPAEA